MRFQRVAAALDVDVARVRLCESSGSEHSLESSLDLTDLVKSFMERNEGEEDKGDQEDRLEIDDQSSDSENREMLQGLLLEDQNEDDEDDGLQNVKKNIRGEVEIAYRLVGDKSSPGFKRRLMTRLRQRGFDAGQYFILFLEETFFFLF